VLHTTNGGLTWTEQTTNTYNELYAGYFIDSNTGWVVGQLGEILHTKDGGKTWRFQRSGTESNLNKVFFADAKHGLIVGDDGVILTTTSGGAKWELQESDTENDLYGFALSPEGMVAVGKGGIAMRYAVDAAELPVELPPVAEQTETPEIVDEQPIVEEVTYHWELVRQATWQTNFTDTYFLDNQIGWAVGSGGVIAHTTDGGKTWLPQHSSVKADLRRITFADDAHGWIAGGGVLLRTENGGKTWQVIQGVLQNFRNISTIEFLNTQEGWLGVNQGQTLHTTDGGLTWKLQKTGTTNRPMTDLHFLNSSEGWAIAPQRADGGFILHTIDGGEYWEIQAKPNQPGVGIHFVDAKSGWIVMGNGRSLVTQDGGMTWKQRYPDDDQEISMRQIKFRNHKEAWGIARNGTILMTHNQGKSWAQIHVVLETENAGLVATRQQQQERKEESTEGEQDNTPPSQEGEPIRNLKTDENFADAFQNRLSTRRSQPGRFTPEGEIGGDEEGKDEVKQDKQEEQPVVRRRRPRSNRQSGLPITNVHFADHQRAWAVGEAGHVYYTADGGETWQRQLGEQLDNFRDVLFLNSAQGWIAGDSGLLMETQDGGRIWTPLQSGTQQPLIGVHFPSLDPKWGWAMRRDGTVLYTTDGVKWSSGQTPTRPGLFEDEPPQPFAVNDVAFGKFSEGWAAGGDGQIIHNQDGGPIWTPQRTSTGKDLESIDMKYAPLGWAVGHSGIIQRTINGGQYWKHHETDTGYDLHGVSFITKRKGWAVGSYGIVLRTTGGGFKWEVTSSGVTQDLYGVLALSEQEIYAVGTAGTIIHSTDGGNTWEQEHTDIANDLYSIVRAKDDNTLWVVGQWGVVLRREIDALEMSLR
jgi:photosystem II stability/assembly factor-like uncharacterized protein